MLMPRYRWKSSICRALNLQRTLNCRPMAYKLSTMRTSANYQIWTTIATLLSGHITGRESYSCSATGGRGGLRLLPQLLCWGNNYVECAYTRTRVLSHCMLTSSQKRIGLLQHCFLPGYKSAQLEGASRIVAQLGSGSCELPVHHSCILGHRHTWTSLPATCDLSRNDYLHVRSEHVISWWYRP